MKKIEIISPVNNKDSVDMILDSGADAVYFGIQNVVNSRNFSNHNIPIVDMPIVIEKCHEKNKRALLVLNSFPAQSIGEIHRVLELAQENRIDAVIVASFSVLELLRTEYPSMVVHVSVMAGISNAQSINLLSRKYNIENIIIPSGLTFREIQKIYNQVQDKTRIKLETVIIGTLGYGFQGKCHLAKFMSGTEVNTDGVCSHPKYYKLLSDEDRYSLYFNEILINRFEHGHLPNDFYPLIKSSGLELLKKENGNGWQDNFLVNKRYVCRGRYKTNKGSFSFQNYHYLNVIPLLDKLINSGISCLKIEGRQRPPEYSIQVTNIVSKCLDMIYDGTFSYAPSFDGVINAFFPDMNSYYGGFNLEDE